MTLYQIQVEIYLSQSTSLLHQSNLVKGHCDYTRCLFLPIVKLIKQNWVLCSYDWKSLRTFIIPTTLFDFRNASYRPFLGIFFNTMTQVFLRWQHKIPPTKVTTHSAVTTRIVCRFMNKLSEITIKIQIKHLFKASFPLVRCCMTQRKKKTLNSLKPQNTSYSIFNKSMTHKRLYYWWLTYALQLIFELNHSRVHSACLR